MHSKCYFIKHAAEYELSFQSNLNKKTGDDILSCFLAVIEYVKTNADRTLKQSLQTYQLKGNTINKPSFLNDFLFVVFLDYLNIYFIVTGFKL